MKDETPKEIKREVFEFGGFTIEVIELDNGKIVLPEHAFENFKKSIMEGKVTDQQARDFSNMIANLKHL